MNTSQPQPNSISDNDLELLSAYVDNELSVAERVKLERRLESDPALQAELDDLRATVTALRTLEPVRPPRSFTIDPATAPRRSLSFPLAWVTQLGSGLAGMVLVLFASVQIFAGGQVSTAFSEVNSGLGDNPAAMSAPMATAAPAAEAAPEVMIAEESVSDMAVQSQPVPPPQSDARIQPEATNPAAGMAESGPVGPGGGAPSIDMQAPKIEGSESSSPDTLDLPANQGLDQPPDGIPPGLLLVLGLVLITGAGASYLYSRQKQ